jgi:HD-GYP domain-containing protein (c-di-GMP phosphodiesterase class II)
MKIHSKNKEINRLLSHIENKLHLLSEESNEKKGESENYILEIIKTFCEKKMEQINHLNDIGMLLSIETNLEHLLGEIISKSKLFTNADGGTLYLMGESEELLVFKIVETDSLGIHMGIHGEKIPWPSVPLYHEDGSQNHEMVAAHCALTATVLNFQDVYNAEGFNFSGTKKFDDRTGFRSKSMLVIPMINSHKDVIGVVQLLNARDCEDNVINFTTEDEKVLLSLASQAAVAITNAKMIKDLRELLESFIKSIAFAIDQKSPYTGGHVHKVASISLKIAKALNKTTTGKYADVHYTKQEIDEIRISALMHDIGKITTPQHVMDKATKLETMYDRINTIRIKYEVYKRDLEIEMLNEKMKLMLSGAPLDEIQLLEDRLRDEIDILDEEIGFLIVSNVGGEFMTDAHIQAIEKIAQRQLCVNGINQNILSEFEVHNLCIRKGTLTEDELVIMRDHARVSNEMLDALPFPKHLRRVPSIAGGHHEKLNGKGYPKGLSADDLSLESRILALADIFEALSASDRPYKGAKKMSEIMKIINFMVKDGELDADLVQFFYDQNIHMRFAKQCFKPDQIDI